MRYKGWEEKPHLWYAWRPVRISIGQGKTKIAWFQDVLRSRAIGDPHRWTYYWPDSGLKQPHYIDKTKTAFCLILLGGLLGNWYWPGLGLVLIAFILIYSEK